jgi:O-antigen/teichoic acid export membrane protein
MPDPTEIVQLEERPEVCVPERWPHDVRRFSVHPLLRNIGLTGITSVVTSLAAMIVISLVGRILGPVLLGEYLLVRRIASWLQAVVVLPSGIALPRYVAANADSPMSTRQNYFLGAIVTACGLALLLIAILVAGKTDVSRVIFGTGELAPLALPLGLLLLGLAAHGAAFGYYQGMLSMGRACSAQLFNLAIIPVLAVVLLSHTRSISRIIEATGLSMLGCAFLFSVPILRGMRLAGVARRTLQHVPELLSFGLSRTWGDFGLQALLSLPAVIAAHYLPMRSVGFLLLGGSFLALVAAATLPLGIILLSQVTRSLAQQGTAQLRSQLVHFVDGLIESSVFVSLQLLVFAGVIIRLWVGPNFADATRVVELLILAVPFYFVYGGLRSVVDAAAIKAHNTRNVLISLAVFVSAVGAARFGFARNHLLEELALTVVIAMAVLCWLTLRTTRRLFKIRARWTRLLPGTGVAVILGACSVVLRAGLHFEPSFAVLFFYELAVSGVYFAGLWLLGSPWLHFLVQTMFSFQSSRPRSAS